METKELKIQIPEGFEIDKEKSTFEKIVFKPIPIDTKPRSWEEYCKNHKGKCFYIDGLSKICETPYLIFHNDEIDRNTLPSKELAEAFLAMMQLMSLRQAWIGDWKPNWENDDYKFDIACKQGKKLLVITGLNQNRPLSFPTEEMASDFINCFKDLLEIAKPLL